MEARKFRIDNYIQVPGFAIVELGLSGNELLCYSLIYGFTQDDETEFHGSLNYVSSALNVTKQNAKKIIDRLLERGLIEKKELYFSGVKFCHYVAKRHSVAETATGYIQNNNGVIETITPPVIETIPNNKDIDITNGDNILFPEEEIVKKKPRGTTEPLCLFANSRYYQYEVFASFFQTPEFAGIDIAYYYYAVADWSSSKSKKRADWIATARNFIRSDIAENKVKRLQDARPTGGLSQEDIDYLNEMSIGL